LTFLTGAGISAGSGIVTYRGVNGIYQDMKEVTKLLSFSNFTTNTKEVWQFIMDFMKSIIDKKQNDGHKCID